MLELKGKYSVAKVFTDNVDQETVSQIINICNQDFTAGSTVRLMPDCHAGAGCTIGFTANLGSKVVPNLIGVDIGCGVLTIELDKVDIDLHKFDDTVHKNVPSGRNVHDVRITTFPLQDLYCYRELKDTKRINKSLGTLGGGNHYIELDKDHEGNIYLVIHSGSRHLGAQVAKYYQDIAIELRSGREEYYLEKDRIIKEYKEQGRRKEIEAALKDLNARHKLIQPAYPKDLCFLDGEWREKYLHDMNLCQEYASVNRQKIADLILDSYSGIRNTEYTRFDTIHNYISFKDNIIRKGSISSYEGEKVIIPLNMRDGSIIAMGKGNSDWNFSAPHGAGRQLSRSKAKGIISMEEYQKSMEGIFTTSVNLATLDEAPMVYKPMEEIISNIDATVNIIDIIKPIYNFKASE